jgi:hypothetical protein
MPERAASYFNDQLVTSDDLNFTESASAYKRQKASLALLTQWGVSGNSTSTALKVTLGTAKFSVEPGTAVDSTGKVICVPGYVGTTDPGYGTLGDDDYRPAGTCPAYTNIDITGSGTRYINIAYARTSGSVGVDDDGASFATRYYDSYTISIDTVKGTGAKVPLGRITTSNELVDERQFLQTLSSESSQGTLLEHRQYAHDTGLEGTLFNAVGAGSLGVTVASGVATVKALSGGDLLFINGSRYSAIDGSLEVTLAGTTTYIWVVGGTTATISSGTTWTPGDTLYLICSVVVSTEAITDLREYCTTIGSHVRNDSTVVTGDTVKDALETLDTAYQAADTVLTSALTTARSNLGGKQLFVSGNAAVAYWLVATLPANSAASYDRVTVELTTGGPGWDSTALTHDIVTFSNRYSSGLLRYVYEQNGLHAADRTQGLQIVAYQAAANAVTYIYIVKPATTSWCSGIVRAIGIGNTGGVTTSSDLTIGDVQYGSATGTTDTVMFDSSTTTPNAVPGAIDALFASTTGHSHNGSYPNGPKLTGSSFESGTLQRSATIVVATNWATNPSSATGYATADFQCDGTNDEVQINQALAALPLSGGKVLLLEGTYNIKDAASSAGMWGVSIDDTSLGRGASLNYCNNITLEGMGRSTILQSGINTSSFAVVRVGSGNYANDNGRHSRITVSNLSIYGPVGTFFNYGVYIYGTNNSLPAPTSWAIDRTVIEKLYIRDCLMGIHARITSYLAIRDNEIENVQYGIYAIEPYFGTIQRNAVRGAITTGGHGISGAMGTGVGGVYGFNTCTLIENNLVLCSATTRFTYGIVVGESHCNISGNTIYGASIGISRDHASAAYNSCVGNHLIGCVTNSTFLGVFYYDPPNVNSPTPTAVTGP